MFPISIIINLSTVGCLEPVHGLFLRQMQLNVETETKHLLHDVKYAVTSITFFSYYNLRRKFLDMLHCIMRNRIQ